MSCVFSAQAYGLLRVERIYSLPTVLQYLSIGTSYQGDEDFAQKYAEDRRMGFENEAL